MGLRRLVVFVFDLCPKMYFRKRSYLEVDISVLEEKNAELFGDLGVNLHASRRYHIEIVNRHHSDWSLRLLVKSPRDINLCLAVVPNETVVS